MASCTVIKTGATVSKTASERVEELKNKINNIQVPIIAKVGDIAFYDSEKNKIIIVDFDKWNGNTDNYPSSRYTPVGVVAIPTSHNVYATGECAVMSLKNMSCDTPDEGSVNYYDEGYEYMFWGQNNKQLGKLFNRVVCVGTLGEPSVGITNMASYAYMPSDSFTGVECPTDPEAKYFVDSTGSSNSYSAAPSPYLADGSRNPIYYQTTDPSSEVNMLSDFDGINNTQLILDNVTVEDWKTSSKIENSYNIGNAPAACCCWRYHTEGTKQGDWYLPAQGELGYIIVRQKKINTTINSLISIYGNNIGVGLQEYFWSSTEYSATQACNTGCVNGRVGNNYRNDIYVVRAYLRVSGSLS